MKRLVCCWLLLACAGCGSSENAAEVSDVPDSEGAAPDAADYEGDAPGECTDRADNDRDGLFDCDDPGCFGSPDCAGADADADADVDDEIDEWPDADADADAGPDADGEIVGDADADADEDADGGEEADADAPDTSPENTVATCLDWIDNDGDGDTDCADSECAHFSFCHCDPPCESGFVCHEGACAPVGGWPPCTDEACAARCIEDGTGATGGYCDSPPPSLSCTCTYGGIFCGGIYCAAGQVGDNRRKARGSNRGERGKSRVPVSCRPGSRSVEVA
jgi:hypothetical protein